MSPLEARAALAREVGAEIDQDDILDEHGYSLSEKLTRVPMSDLSAGCRISLQFVYRGNVAERSGSGVLGGLKRGMGTIFTRAQQAEE